MRITAQLISVADQSHLWADDYDRKLQDVLSVQDDVAIAVADQTQLKLDPTQQNDLTRNRTVIPEAYEAYLRGRFFWNKRTEDGFRKSIEYYDTAIARDPTFAQAYAGLADAYVLLGGYGIEPESISLPKAKAAALKGLTIDARSADAYTSLAMVAMQYEWDWKEAEKNYKRAIELDPNYSVAHHWYGDGYLAAVGSRATLLWLEEQEALLPDVPYSGIVFTMPSELWPVFKRNRHLLHDLPVLAAGVIQQLIAMKYGARALIMAVLHTFGGDLKFNSHVHLLVSAGGLYESDGRWSVRLPLNKVALMRMWRYAVIFHLRLALKAGVLKSDRSIQEFRDLLSGAYQSERHRSWVIFVDGIVSKAHFLRYAARYVRRPPIATWRLLNVTNEEVEFVAKKNEDIHHDDERSDRRPSYRSSRGVAEWNQASHGVSLH